MSKALLFLCASTAVLRLLDHALHYGLPSELRMTVPFVAASCLPISTFSSSDDAPQPTRCQQRPRKGPKPARPEL